MLLPEYHWDTNNNIWRTNNIEPGRHVVSDTLVADTILTLQQRERELELEACTIRARIEEIRDMLARLQHPGRRRGRPAGPRAAPLHVAGAAHEIPTEDEPGDVA
jgi:hypothetical protein